MTGIDPVPAQCWQGSVTTTPSPWHTFTASQGGQQPARTPHLTRATTLRARTRRFPSRHPTAGALRTPAHIGTQAGFAALHALRGEGKSKSQVLTTLGLVRLDVLAGGEQMIHHRGYPHPCLAVAGWAPDGWPPGAPAIVELALCWVFQNGVGLIEAAEARFGLGIVGVQIRMETGPSDGRPA